MLDLCVSRRRLLTGASATVVAGGLAGRSAALAKAPMLNTPAPAFYRFKLGTIEATAVSDGPLSIGDPKNTFRGPTVEELSKMMSDQFLPTNNVVLDQNVLVINTGDKLALFETGMSSVKRNDAMGRLVANLRLAGIDPADIDAVIPTHAHIDHIGGIMAADGSRNFPNAQIHIAKADLEFWTDDKRLGTPAEGSALAAKKNLLPNRCKWCCRRGVRGGFTRKARERCVLPFLRSRCCSRLAHSRSRAFPPWISRTRASWRQAPWSS